MGLEPERIGVPKAAPRLMRVPGVLFRKALADVPDHRIPEVEAECSAAKALRIRRRFAS